MFKKIMGKFVRLKVEAQTTSTTGRTSCLNLFCLLTWLFLCFSSSGFAQNIIPRIDFDNAGVIDVVQILAKEAGMDLVVSADNSSQKKVTLHLRNISPEDAISYVLQTNGLTYEKKGNSILVSTLPQDITQSGYKRITKGIELKYISAEKATTIIGKILPQTSVISGGRANHLVVGGKDSEVFDAVQLIEKIDKPIPQILIEGKVVEVSKSDILHLGLNYNDGVFHFINEKPSNIVSTLNALLAKGEANLIASPRIATLDNHEAIINIGDRIPYAVPVSSSGAATQWTVDYIDAGVKLKITPQVGKDSQIIMALQPEVSAISEWKMTTAGEFPVISTRNASSTLRTKSGETVIVGGLNSETERVNTSRIPIIGQFPILNLLFQNRTVEKTKTEIIFLITPYIV